MGLTQRWPVGNHARVVDGEWRETRAGRIRPWQSEEQRALGPMLSRVPWDVYLTWQFRSAIGEDGILREVRHWLGCLRFAYGDQLGWMIGYELDYGASWGHAHGLAVALPSLAEPVELYVGKPHEKRVPFLEPFWLAWQRRHGGGFFKLIDGSGGECCFYCAKYAAKRGSISFSTGLERFMRREPCREVVLVPAHGKIEEDSTGGLKSTSARF